MARSLGAIRALRQRLAVLASVRRLLIASELKRRKSMTVGELAKAIRSPVPALSQHLRILRLAGIVKPVRRGRFVAYRLALSQEQPAKQVIAML